MTEENSEILLNKMSKAYMDPEVEKIPELQKILLKHASELNENMSYIQVVTGLSNEISAYYLKHHSIPESVLNVYNHIKSEVRSGKIDADEMRKHALAAGILSFPINFGSL